MYFPQEDIRKLSVLCPFVVLVAIDGHNLDLEYLLGVVKWLYSTIFHLVF